MKRLLLIFMLMSPAVLVTSGLQAQMTCTGGGCAFLPLDQGQLNSIYDNLKTQYFDQVFDDMAEATVMAGINTSPMGAVNLEGVTIGANLAAGYRTLEEVDVLVPGVGTLDDLPSTGAAAQPRLYLGVNLGSILGSANTIGVTPAWYSPKRFDLYLSYLDYSVDQPASMKDEDSNMDWTVGAKVKGIELRYQLVRGDHQNGESSMFDFLGLSVGLGYHELQQDVTFTNDPEAVTINLESNTNVVWDASDNFIYEARITTIPLDFRLGFRFLYLFSLSLGGGVAWSRGNADFTATRSGPAYLESDLASVLGFTVPDANLGLTISGSGNPPARTSFAAAGLELNFFFYKLYVEARGNEQAYSANLGMRLQF